MTNEVFDQAIAQASKAFGHDFVEAFLDCRDRFAFVQYHFAKRPLACCILYAIEESMTNANDDHGRAVWSKAWDDCFAATLSCWLDDWSMIEHSGIWKGLSFEAWQVLGDCIHAYHRGEQVSETALCDIELDIAETDLSYALEAFKDAPKSDAAKFDLLDAIEHHARALRVWTLETYSNAKEEI